MFNLILENDKNKIFKFFNIFLLVLFAWVIFINTSYFIEKIIFGSSLNNNIGLLEKANTGTILFDEIGDLPINIQSQILNFLLNNFYKKFFLPW